MKLSQRFALQVWVLWPVLAGVLVIVAPAQTNPIAARLGFNYDPEDLGLLTGFSAIVANAVNDEGHIAGAAGAGNNHNEAYLYSHGVLTGLGYLPDGRDSQAYAINVRDQVVGNGLNSSGNFEGFVYRGGALTGIGFLPGGNYSIAVGINERGQVVGTAYESPYDEGAMGARAILYSDGVMRTIGVLPGGSYSVGAAINERGEVVGSGDVNAGPEQAFLYSGGVMRALGLLPGGSYTAATAINSSGQVVGIGDIDSGDYEGFLYSGGVMHPFCFVVCGGTYPYAINRSGEIVGTVQNRAYLYSGRVSYDLNSLVVPGSLAGVTLTYATGISDSGLIIANGSNNHAYLLRKRPRGVQ